MTDVNTLTPCPFCGERAETDFIPEHHSYQIECSDSMGCTARVTRDSVLGAIEAWNCRAPSSAAGEAQPVAAPAGILPVASKSHGAWDGIEDVLELPDGTDIYAAAQVQAMLAAGIAPGWQAVPVEPTKEMKVAAVKFANGPAVYKAVAAAALEIEEGIYGEAYEAMLAAAPSGPAREPLSQERLQFLSGEYEDIPEEGVAFRDGWRSAEMHHGITAAKKGGQHGTE